MSQICSAIGAAKRVMGGLLKLMGRGVGRGGAAGIAGNRGTGRIPYAGRGAKETGETTVNLASACLMSRGDLRYSPYVGILPMTVHILKLCVGAASVEDLLAWHAANPSRLPGGARRHVTRMWPKRADEILDGGSLYWVMAGQVRARQRILDLTEVDHGDGVRRCGLILDPEVIRTHPAPRRPFQGWRYLDPDQAPGDLGRARPGDDDDLPPGMAEALAEFGLR